MLLTKGDRERWDFCVCGCLYSGHRGCLHRGAPVLQQPGGHREPKSAEEAQSLSLQEGNRDLQLLLFQHHTGSQAQQTGGRTGEPKKDLSVRYPGWIPLVLFAEDGS